MVEKMPRLFQTNMQTKNYWSVETRDDGGIEIASGGVDRIVQPRAALFLSLHEAAQLLHYLECWREWNAKMAVEGPTLSQRTGRVD